ncbi:MAG: hypothetical protein RIA71_07385 [Oceanicaulis sp.]
MAEPKKPAGRGDGAARNAAQLKREIESGAHRDKVSYPDPGASPLGTDDEAAGRPADAERERIELSSRTAASGDAPTDAGIGSAKSKKPFRKIQSAPRADPDDEAIDRVETSPVFRLAVFGGAALIIAVAIGLKLAL